VTSHLPTLESGGPWSVLELPCFVLVVVPLLDFILLIACDPLCSAVSLASSTNASWRT